MKIFSQPLLYLTTILLSLCATAANAADYYDPPGRVARISDYRGALSYSPAGENGWYEVQRNRPLVRGDRLWADRNSRLELQVGSAAVRLDEQTSLRILELNDNLLQLEVTQGSVNLSVRRFYPGQQIEVDTPNLAFVITQPGKYRIDVNPNSDYTTIVDWQGNAVAYGDRDQFPLRSGDVVRFYDRDLRDYEFFNLPREDDFDRYCSYRDRQLYNSVSLRYLDDDLIGYSDLDAYGYWRPVSQYGNVWFPNQISANWAPYRYGQWMWIEPWGWTWVDNEPWGFAPSHYGRWVYISGRWGWIPGHRSYRPVYAPALVVFIGSSGWGLSFSFGSNSLIGWFPLGPSEVYIPPYQTSRGYFDQVNISNTVINNVTINNVYNNYSSGTIDSSQTNYVNRRVSSAVTAVPARSFVNSEPVQSAFVRMDPKVLKRGELAYHAPIAPRLRSVVGAENQAKVRPERSVEERPVFVRTPPPAAIRPFVEREKVLQQKPGRPLRPQPAGGMKEGDRRYFKAVPQKSQVIDARAAGPRRDEGNTPVPAAQRKPLDRSIETRRPPVKDSQDKPRSRDATPMPTPVSPSDTQAQAEARAQAQAARQAAQQAAQAEREAKARANQQAQAEARAQAQAEREARARADQQAQAEARAQAQAARQAAQRAAQAEREAQARANQQAQAEARARAQAAQQAAQQSAEAERAARSAAARADRDPPACLTPQQVQALKQQSRRDNVDVPAYVPCASGNQ